jgi:hypothetical protein
MTRRRPASPMNSRDALYRVRPELRRKGYFILVSNEAGEEIHRAAVRPTILV